jgi:hypothetical protein
MNAVRVALVLCLVGSLALAQTTQPSIALEVTATQKFNRGEYAAALPMYEKLAEQLKDRPDQLGRVQEQIRVCKLAIAKAMASAPDPQSAATDAMAQPGTAPEQRKPHPAPQDGQAIDLGIKDLGNFDYDPQNGGLPDDVKRLSGATLRTHGFMVPMDQADQITEFALVPSLFGCCFGQPPQIQHTILVHCPKGKSLSYFPDEISVTGTLKVDEKKEDGYIVSVFELTAESVKPAAK